MTSRVLRSRVMGNSVRSMARPDLVDLTGGLEFPTEDKFIAATTTWTRQDVLTIGDCF